MPAPTPDVAARLDALKAEVRREATAAAKQRPRARARKQPAHVREVLAAVALAAAKVAVVLVLPFFVLVRVSVDAYRLQGLPTWVALATGATLTLLLLAGYAAWLSRAVSRRARFALMARWVALPLVVGYCGYALLFLSSVNAKNEPVRAFYTSVHPLVRVALSTLILVDGDVVITDMARRPEDYRRMGLPLNERTRHYRQADGWVHAVDLRTAGRSELKNRLVQAYFWAMGFGTLRHVGTSDHLHIELN